jgi:hypothetical protein
MDANSDLLSVEMKNKAYDVLTEIMISSLEQNKMTVKESEDSAEFIYKRLEAVKTRSELYAFLKELADQWFIYQPAYVELTKDDLMTRAQDELKQISNQGV